MKKSFVLLFCLLPAGLSVSFSQYLDVKSLKDLDSISVWIESLDSTVENLGITKELLKTELVNSLGATSLTIVDETGDKLYLTISALKSDLTDEIACNIKLELLQGVWLERTNEWNYGSTWFREFLGLYKTERLKSEIEATSADLTTLFIRDLLSVNPALRRKKD